MGNGVGIKESIKKILCNVFRSDFTDDDRRKAPQEELALGRRRRRSSRPRARHLPGVAAQQAGMRFNGLFGLRAIFFAHFQGLFGQFFLLAIWTFKQDLSI